MLASNIIHIMMLLCFGVGFSFPQTVSFSHVRPQPRLYGSSCAFVNPDIFCFGLMLDYCHLEQYSYCSGDGVFKMEEAEVCTNISARNFVIGNNRHLTNG